jgi:pimeloyl-ACP methyl ester carboxylesterase
VTTWVLLRGLTRERAHWGRFIEQLGLALPQDSIVALDLPGAGVLCRLRSPTTVTAMVESCRRQLRDRDLAPPYRLLGLSMGGMVVAQWALAHPDELAACVVVNASMRPLSPMHHRLRPSCWPALLKVAFSSDGRGSESAVLDLTSNSLADTADRRALLTNWHAIRCARPVSLANALRQLIAAARFRLPRLAPAAPALVVCSLGDRLVDPRCSQALAAHWRCPMVSHPSAGHDLALDDGPWLAERVREWLAPRGPAGPVCAAAR